MTARAFILRIKPNGIFRVEEALKSNQLIIGWSQAEGLLDLALSYEQFRSIIHATYHEKDTDEINSGRTATHLWRFIREISEGDLVLVPFGKEIYLAEVSPGNANFVAELQDDDIGYRRDVRWHNNKKPFPRSAFSADIIHEIDTLLTTSREISQFYGQVLALTINSMHGETWTDKELDAIAGDYRDMLLKELRGLPLNKSEHRRNLMLHIERTEGSIEFKHQNISAVLQKAGSPWIDGYKPLANFQVALIAAVERIIANDLENSGGGIEAIIPLTTEDIDLTNLFTTPPSERPEKEVLSEPMKRLARKIDQAARDNRNRDLGKAGENFVFRAEKQRLAKFPQLAADVDWVSQSKGDGLGYDIESFDELGKKIFIEVKTTKGDEKNPFFISANELEAAKKLGTSYRLYRVYGFGTKPQIYILMGPLEESIDLKASVYKAIPK